jgi:hypothetical protein
MRDPGRRWWLAICLAASLAACTSPPPPPPGPGPAVQRQAAADAALAAEVTRFLDAWLIKRDPQAAVAGKTSTAFVDERFMPPAALSPDEYKAQMAAPAAAPADPVTPQAFQAAMQSQLSASLQVDAAAAPPNAAVSTSTATLATVLADFSPEAAKQKEPDLIDQVGHRTPRALTVSGVAVLAYPAREWRDIAWASSPVIGFRFAMADIISKRGIDVQAVVARLKPVEEAVGEVTVLTLWSDEGSQGARWRLLGVARPPSE